MESNFEQCRTCLVHGNEMVSLQADHVVCNKVMSVLELLKTCTSIQVQKNMLNENSFFLTGFIYFRLSYMINILNLFV